MRTRSSPTRAWEQRIASPKGSLSPLEPCSLKWPNIDATAKAWLADDARMALLSKQRRAGHAGSRRALRKALLPFTSNVVVDGRLVTRQNPQSAKATTERVAALL